MYLLSILKAQGRDRKGGLMKDPTLTMPAYRRKSLSRPKISATVYVLGSQNLYSANVDGHFTTTIGRCRRH